MNKIESGDIKKGMRFSAPVFFDDGKNMFLAEGKSAKSYHIAALKRWVIPFVMTSGHELKGEELSKYLAAKNKKATVPPKTAQAGGHKANVAVDMSDTADVTDLFADAANTSDVAEADTARAANGEGIKNLKVEQELDAEDVTSMFM